MITMTNRDQIIASKTFPTTDAVNSVANDEILWIELDEKSKNRR